MGTVNFAADACTYPDYVHNNTVMSDEDWVRFVNGEILTLCSFVGDKVSGDGALDLLIDLMDTCDNAAEANLADSATWALRADIIRHVLANLD